MKIRVGILGLPNVGKSTLFNALAQKSQAQAENFPFCTIEPNVAPIALPDENLAQLAAFAGSRRAVPATLEFVDVAGLCKGASRGEGLSSRFLATLRECAVLCHVVRSYEDPDVVHVEGKVEPTADAEVVNLELVLADLAHVERRLEKLSGKNKGVFASASAPASPGSPDASSRGQSKKTKRVAASQAGDDGEEEGEERRVLERVVRGLNAGVPARALALSPQDRLAVKSMGLLTLKPVLYCFNVDEVDFSLGYAQAAASARAVFQGLAHSGDGFTLVSAKVEAELSLLNKAQQRGYLAGLGLGAGNEEEAEAREEEQEQEAGPGRLEDLLSYTTLPALIVDILGLGVAYTGPGVAPERSRTVKAHLFKLPARRAAAAAAKMARTPSSASSAQAATSSRSEAGGSHASFTADCLAGRIHGDLQKGFLRAEVVPAAMLQQHKTFAAAKEAGCVSTEGKDYALGAGDVVLIKWK